jgi:chlorophyllide a reductase subunit X
MPEDGPRLELLPMNAVPQLTMADFLRAEAAVEPDPVHTAAPTKTTQIIAIYGKGGSGKSFALSTSAT